MVTDGRDCFAKEGRCTSNYADCILLLAIARILVKQKMLHFMVMSHGVENGHADAVGQVTGSDEHDSKPFV